MGVCLFAIEDNNGDDDDTDDDDDSGGGDKGCKSNKFHQII